ncbi:MAG: hypothetical protein RR419_07490, partial [Akkermansia sp.]
CASVRHPSEDISDEISDEMGEDIGDEMGDEEGVALSCPQETKAKDKAPHVPKKDSRTPINNP